MAAKVTSGYYSKFNQKVNTNDFKSNAGATKSSKADFITQNKTAGTAKTVAKVTKAPTNNNKDINLNNPKTVTRGKTPRPTTDRNNLGQT